MKLLTRNIIVRPDKHIAEVAISLSRKIAGEFKTDFVLDGKTFFPHITIYQAAYPEKNIAEVEKQIVKAVKSVKPFDVKLFEYQSMLGFVFWNAEKDNPFLSLHKKIITGMNSLREGSILPGELPRLSDPQVPDFIKQSIKNYGAALAMDAFTPHLTITHFINPSDASLARETLSSKKLQFCASSVWLANIGPHGTVNEILQEFPFG